MDASIMNMIYGGIAGLGLAQLLGRYVLPKLVDAVDGVVGNIRYDKLFTPLSVNVNGADVEMILPQDSRGARRGLSDTQNFLRKKNLPIDIDYTKGEDGYKFVIHCDSEQTAGLLAKVLRRNKTTSFRKNNDLSKFCIGTDGKVTFLAKKESLTFNRKAMREGGHFLSIAEDLLVPLNEIADDEGLDEELQQKAYGFVEVIENSDNLRRDQFENIVYLVDEFADKLAAAGEMAYSDMLKDVLEDYK